ncbi:glycoside hydrolase family 5 protein [Cohnella sp.]|uniref:glycoside hydrolase family 5 protein n=1 Tax=Cohnella sp. TaxID=1883426 RepID=UPI003566F44A
MQRLNEVKGFLRASGKKVVNGHGQEVLLRGVGFGSWLLPEGYMWRFPEGGDRPRKIERMVEELIGPDKANRFWELYHEHYIMEEDIRAIDADGFNSVRIPINARLLIENEQPLRMNMRHLEIIDRVIDWCRNYSLYVILDLHGAPGGQTGTNIDDSERDRPELFTEEKNKQVTIALWRMLAERYKEEWIVAGYDLLNEPLPEWFSEYNDQVMPLYKEIVEAIREVDDRHMIILEGVHWATDWSIFKEKVDDNLMLQFHKYWNNPDTESIQPFLDKREEWDVPIFMGEGGENNCDWFAGVFRLYEDHDISWNFWTWKKLDCTNSPYSIRMPDGWQLLVDYLEGGQKPDHETAERILWQYLDNLKLNNCDYQPQVVNALFRRPLVRIPAIFYGYRGEGESFGIKQKAKQSIGFRDGDGTEICFQEGQRATPNFQHMKGEEWLADEWLYVQLSSYDWLAYEYSIPADKSYSLYMLDFCIRSSGGTLLVYLDEVIIGAEAANGNGWQIIRLPEPLEASEGLKRLKIQAVDQPVAIKWLSIAPC